MNLTNILAKRPNKTIYRDGDKTVKLFEPSFSKADILNEALNHARVEETGLHIPRLLEVTVIDGKWAIVLEYIEGATLHQLMKDHPEKYDEYLNLFVDLQMEIHARRSPLLTKLRDKMRRKISQSELDATVRYDLFTRLESTPKHEKLCHGDYNPHNVVITADGRPYIVDWAHATQGNASADAARTYLFMTLQGDTKGADAYLRLFCQKSDTARQYVQKWLPIVAASQSVKSKPEEKELLHLWAAVVDYQ